MDFLIGTALIVPGGHQVPVALAAVAWKVRPAANAAPPATNTAAATRRRHHLPPPPAAPGCPLALAVAAGSQTPHVSLAVLQGLQGLRQRRRLHRAASSAGGLSAADAGAASSSVLLQWQGLTCTLTAKKTG